MKALKIKTIVKLKSGVEIPSGAIVYIVEAYEDIKSIKDDQIPCQIITNVFSSLQNYTDKKLPVQDTQDFNPSFMSVFVSVSDYEKVATQDLLINTIKSELEKVYPNKIEIINI